MYAYWVCAARETPIFSPEFLFRSISFSQITQKNPFRSITILHLWRILPFRRPSFSKPVAFIASHGRLSPNAAGQSASQTRPGSSGDSHFHAQNGSSSFRSPAFSRSSGSSFRSPSQFFTLPRHIPIPKFGVSTNPPPPPPLRVLNAYRSGTSS